MYAYLLKSKYEFNFTTVRNFARKSKKTLYLPEMDVSLTFEGFKYLFTALITRPFSEFLKGWNEF